MILTWKLDKDQIQSPPPLGNRGMNSSTRLQIVVDFVLDVEYNQPLYLIVVAAYSDC